MTDEQNAMSDLVARSLLERIDAALAKGLSASWGELHRLLAAAAQSLASEMFADLENMSVERTMMGSTQREAMDIHLGGGFFAYLERLRESHQPQFVKGRETAVVYAGCTCGALCIGPYLLRHINDLIASYEAKVQDFADETQCSTELRERAERAEARERDAVGQVEALLGVFDDWVIANEPLGFIGRESSRVQEVRAFLGRVETQNETTQ